MFFLVVNMATAIDVYNRDGKDFSSYPVLLNRCDNTAVYTWINRKTSTVRTFLGSESTRSGIRLTAQYASDPFLASPLPTQ